MGFGGQLPGIQIAFIETPTFKATILFVRVTVRARTKPATQLTVIGTHIAWSLFALLRRVTNFEPDLTLTDRRDGGDSTRRRAVGGPVRLQARASEDGG